MALVQITPDNLRAAVADPRYWQQGHPERAAFNAWVTGGYQSMYGGKAPPEGRGTVSVQACTRTRNGHTEDVAAHTRGSPARQHGDTPTRDAFYQVAAARPPRDVNGQPGMPGDRQQVQGTGGGGGSLRSTAAPAPGAVPSPGSLRPSPPTPEGLRAASERMPNWSDRVRYRGGGEAQRQADLEALQPQRFVLRKDGVRAGILPDGREAILRNSERNGTTLEIHDHTKRNTLRFNTNPLKE